MFFLFYPLIFKPFIYIYFIIFRISYLEITSIIIMTLGAILASANDLEFDAMGYLWMSLNCLCTSGYVLYMRYASTSIKLPR